MANTIYINSTTNPLFTFDDDQIVSISAEMAVNVIGEELSADAFEAEINYEDIGYAFLNLEYASRIYYYDGADQIAMYYSTNVKRIGKTRYVLYGTSFVGLFDKETFYGGIYTAQTFQAVVNDIICAKGFEKYKQYNKFYTGVTSASGSNLYGVFLTNGHRDQTMDCEWHSVLRYRRALPSGYSTYVAGNNVYQRYYGLRVGSSGSQRFLTFEYGTQSDGGTTVITLGDIIDHHLVPNGDNMDLTIKITHLDGTVTTRTKSFTKKTDAVKLSVWGGAVNDSGGSGNGTLVINNFVSFDYVSLEINSPTGTPIVKSEVLQDMNDGKVYIRNAVNGITVYDADAVVNEDDLYTGEVSSDDIVEVSELAQEIMDSISYSDEVKSLKVYGWIGVMSRREALYQLMFSSCVNLLKDQNGFIFTYLSNDSYGEISDESIYNEGSFEPHEDVRLIELTEHNYGTAGSSKQIFDNSDETPKAENYIIEFNDAPIYGTPTAGTGITIIAHNCNAALVNGNGIITGVPYNHGKKVIEEKVTQNVRGKTVTISDATMVTFMTSGKVMDRLKAYYQSAYKVNPSIIYNNSAENDPKEQCGYKYEFKDCFEDYQFGFLSKLSLKVSKIIKAVCSFVCGYVAPDASNEFQHYTILTGSGTWTVPDGVTKFQAVLIGGGQGGSSGYRGENADDPGHTFRSTVPAKGGAVGATGEPGKVLTIDVSSPAASYSYSCGSGGTGGARSSDLNVSNAGNLGTDTTFGSFSSANGAKYQNGIVNVLTGLRYAYKKEIWVGDGGKGGDGGYAVYLGNNRWQFVDPEPAYNNVTGISYSGGTNGQSISSGSSVIAVGGSGGGGRIGQSTQGATGPNGLDATYNQYVGTTNYYYRGGKGGYGGTYVGSSGDFVPPTPEYGCGGAGGCGGGGAGACGAVNPNYTYEPVTNPLPQGGLGSKGGTGGSGCVIIYY